MEIEKCIKVLANFLNPKFEVKNDCYLETLLTLLDKKYSEDTSEALKFHCQSWIPKALHLWEEETIPKASIAAFTLKLLSFIVQNEQEFLLLKEAGTFDNIEIGLRKHPKLLSPSLKLAHIVLLKAIAKHNSGLQWIKDTKQWKTCSSYYEDTHTVYVIRETYEFLYTILEQFASESNRDDELCVEILSNILSCLINRPWASDVVVVDDENVQRQNLPVLNLICFILEKCIESKHRSRISYHILVTLKFEGHLWKLADMSHDQVFLGCVLRAFVLSNFARFSSMEIPETDPTAEELPLDRFVLNFYNYMNFCIRRRSSRNIIMMSEMNNQLWKKLGDRAPLELMKTHKIKFGDQVLLLQLLPIIVVIKGRKSQEREYLDDFCLSLYKISCEFTIRLMYAFRDLLRTNAENIPDLAYKSIQGILAMRESLSRERAIIVFQALSYTLKEFTPDICVQGEKAEVDVALVMELPNLLSAIFTGLYELIKNYRLTWNECFETLTLVNFMLAFLNNPNLSMRLSVQALKLTQLSIEHFLAPNLALLLDTLKGSGLENLGPMISKRLHDINWETRDSTLELLCSMTQISEMKFPAFQQHILTNGICPIVVSMAKNDMEPYVRASALKCLTAMIKIDLFWDESLSSADIVGLVLHMLANESEGIVRREAVNTLKSIYVNKEIPKHYFDSVFSTAAHSATNDLYWEVKVNTLCFWKSVVCHQLHHQGMIDGNFPSVTFSKELKKIVTLNEREILMRLNKMMVELSARGCLGVLLACLNDESDLEVVKTAVKITQKLLDCLTKYHYLDKRHTLNNGVSKPVDEQKCKTLSPKKQMETPLSAINGAKETNDSTPMDADTVIESIVNSTDINLLAMKYQKDMSLNGSQSHINDDVDDPAADEKIDEFYYKEFAKVSVDEFLNTVNNVDLNEIVEKRSEWLSQTESFESLLDDILTSFNDDSQVNDADCY